MKKTLTAFAFAAVFAACNSNPKTNTDSATLPTTVTDSSRFKDSSLTDNGQEINMNGVSDTIITSNGQYVKVQPEDVVVAEPKVVKTTKPRRKTTAASSGTAANENGTGTVTTQVPAEKKKGWSNAAKGAVIGAGTGAVAGAIISKKKGKGAVIGGLIGAGGGYVIGKSKDKQEKKQ